MISVNFQGRTLTLDGKSFTMPYEIHDAFVLGERVIVLINPNAYLNDPSYSKERRRGINPFRNLLALSTDGSLEWEAEFPENVDYYYLISSKFPLIANSFSSYKCEIDVFTGKIKTREFVK